MNGLLRVLSLVGMLGAHAAFAQVVSAPVAGAISVEPAPSEDLKVAAERAKQTALQQMRRLGGQAAQKANQLQSLLPHKFLERIAVDPVAGPSTIAAPPKDQLNKPIPSVNWTVGEGPTTGHPGVALLLARKDGESEYVAQCSGTLVRQNVILTAAHCMCWSKNPDENYPTGASCVKGGGGKQPAALSRADNWRVFFQHVGVREVSKVIINEGYRFDDDGVRNDLALLVLAEPIKDINPPPLPVSASPASPWQKGEIIGFGFSATGVEGATVLSQLTRPGLKAKGGVNSSRCDGHTFLDPASSLCSLFSPEFGGSEATVCSGDSGGPLRLFDTDGTEIGVTSGRNKENCAATGTIAFQMATSYVAHRKWIDDNLQPFTVAPTQGRWPTFGESLRDVIQRRNAVPFDESGAYLSEGWMQEATTKKVLATVNSSGAISAFEMQNRAGTTLCKGQAGVASHMRNVDYCSATVPAGVQFRIVAKGQARQFLQYVVSSQ